MSNKTRSINVLRIIANSSWHWTVLQTLHTLYDYGVDKLFTPSALHTLKASEMFSLACKVRENVFFFFLKPGRR